MLFTRISLASAFLLSLTEAVPAPVKYVKRKNPPLVGSEDLIGYSKDEKISHANTDDVEYYLEPGQKQDADLGTIINFDGNPRPQPIRGSLGGTDPGPQNDVLSGQNPDKLAPPGTDNGATINAQWPLALSASKLGLQNAGWSRQENTNVMPAATEMAGVDMRLEPFAYRELHWHIAAEWSLVLNGSARIAAVNEEGETFIDDVSAGDVWFFPEGVPHSIQALEGGVEFMLVFNQGDFSEDNTFLISEQMLHVSKETLGKNFHLPPSAFDPIPDHELFIFPGTDPGSLEKQNVTGPAGIIPQEGQYSYHLSEQPAHEVQGGSIKIIDPRSFPIAKDFSAALVTVKPGAMREIHWHPASDEWTFIISGQARGTLFTPPDQATTFDYRAGDIAYFPKSNSHYLENTGAEDLVYLEVLQAPYFSDLSLGQWLGETPKQIVGETLNLPEKTLSQLRKEKLYIVQGDIPAAATQSNPPPGSTPTTGPPAVRKFRA